MAYDFKLYILTTIDASNSVAMNIEQFRKAGYQAIDRICDYYYSLENRQVVSSVEPGYLRKALPPAAPEVGEDFEKIADDYQRFIMPGKLKRPEHPSFFAYFPTACTFEGMLGDLYASSACNPGFNWSCSPACTELEAIATDWTARLLGLDESFLNTSEVGGGVMQTTASDSALTAVVAARFAYVRRYPEVEYHKLVVYTTTETHSLGAKAALVLGINCRALEVSSEDNLSLRGDTFQKALDEDLKSGKHPFILIATVGTTSSGAIDHLSEVAVVAQRYPSIWLHVDAAWAGMALSCPEYRELCQLNAINLYATSFCTNLHKWGLTNFDASMLWVRNRKYLTDALDVTPEFLRTKHGDSGTVIDYRNWHLGLGRRFRSLKVWFVLRSFGAEGLRSYIRKGVDLNNHFASLIRSSTQFELAVPPSFSLTVFKTKPLLGGDTLLASQDILTRKLYERVSERKDILLTQTVLRGVFCIRFAVGAARTESKHIDAAFNLLCEEAKQAVLDLSELQKDKV